MAEEPAKGLEKQRIDLTTISEDLSIVMQGVVGDSLEYRYRLFHPRPLANSKRPTYPLVLWLHGGGFEPGSDNVSHLAYIDSQIYKDGLHGDYPFFILAPQCPKDTPWFVQNRLPSQASEDRRSGQDMLDVVTAVLEKTVEENAIDPDRISVVGISSGADAALEACSRGIVRFAAVAPLAGSCRYHYTLERMLDTSIWAFHSIEDETPIEGVRLLRSRIAQAGGRTFFLTEIPGDSHSCWFDAFSDYGLLGWLLRQERNSVAETPPYRKTRDVLRRWFNDRTLFSLPLPVLIGVLFIIHLRAKIARSRTALATTSSSGVEPDRSTTSGFE